MKGKIEEKLPMIKQRLLLRFSSVDLIATTSKGAEEIAKNNAPKYDIIVSCGGDGTLHEVVNGVMKSGEDTVVGVLPYGTCNDVARTIGVPFNLNKALDCIMRLNTSKYDLIYDGNEYATYALATGYLTKSSYDASSESKKKLGRFAYVLSGIKNLFKFRSYPITIKADGERIHGKFSYMMLINGESAGGFKLNKGDDFNDGKVKLVLVKGNRFSSFWAFVRLFLFGIKSVKKARSVIIRNVKKVDIENHSNVAFTLDGEKTKFLKKSINIVSSLNIITK